GGQEARQRDRGPGRGDRRQLRTHRARPDGRAPRGDHRLAAEPAGHHARARQRPVCAQRPGAAGPDDRRHRGLRPGLRRRGRRRSVRDPRGGGSMNTVTVLAHGGSEGMYLPLLANIGLMVLAGFVGFTVISKVPNTLHTPLMSGTNAIHGIVVLGALVVLGELPADAPVGVQIIVLIALIFGTLNVVGGFVVTDRMLGMFKSKKPQPQAQAANQSAAETKKGDA